MRLPRLDIRARGDHNTDRHHGAPRHLVKNRLSHMRFYAIFSSISLLTITFITPSALVAQDCVSNSLGPAHLTAAGNIHQGKTQGCLIAADISGGLRAGHSIGGSTGGGDYCGISRAPTALDGFMALEQCLIEEGFYSPENGSARGLIGFTEALCRCNEMVFGIPFVCDELMGSTYNSADTKLIQELLKNNCIVIATLEVFTPTRRGWLSSDHSVSVSGVDGDALTISDSNDPDTAFSVTFADGGFNKTALEKVIANGVVARSLVSLTIKCPRSSDETGIPGAAQQ